MEIKEKCLYNSSILCGGVVERLSKCWQCEHNPDVIHRQQLEASAQAPVEASGEEAKPRENKPVKARKTIGWDKAKKLYDAGFNDLQIAVELDCAHSSVARWRMRNDLPPRGKGGKPKNEELL